jgi:tetratricopeptide (TPR) repeat protein
MNKITFTIPKSTQQKVIQSTKQPNDIKYVQIAPNVYKFGTDIDDALYHKAVELRKTNVREALVLFETCKTQINDSVKPELAYEIFVNLALLVTELDGSLDIVEHYYEDALKICPGRAEPYYYLSIYYQKRSNYEKSYELLKKALSLSYEEVNNKYSNVQKTAYGKYLYDNLSVACYWLKKHDEAIHLIETIIDDPDFSNYKERLQKNLELSRIELTTGI